MSPDLHFKYSHNQCLSNPLLDREGISYLSPYLQGKTVGVYTKHQSEFVIANGGRPVILKRKK